jgi:hypothetical protein
MALKHLHVMDASAAKNPNASSFKHIFLFVVMFLLFSPISLTATVMIIYAQVIPSAMGSMFLASLAGAGAMFAAFAALWSLKRRCTSEQECDLALFFLAGKKYFVRAG